jgi:CheY-like chemotaxis protein
MEVVDALTRLFAAVAWPAAFISVAIMFRVPVAEFIRNLSEISLKGGGIDLSAKRAEAAAAISAAVVSRSAEFASDSDVEARQVNSPRSAVTTVQRAITPLSVRNADGARILWVDDKPEGNIFERQSLEALGMTCVLARSTSEAIRVFDEQRFDVILSDVKRPEGDRAGFDLLTDLRRGGVKTPFIFYTGYGSSKLAAEARKLGAHGFTNQPDELFRLVLHSLKQRT